MFLRFVNLQQIENVGVYDNALHEKVVILHSYLKGICESDEHLKIVSSFNSRTTLSILPQFNKVEKVSPLDPSSKGSERRQRSPSFGSTPRQYWQHLSQLVLNKGLSFEEWSCDIILRVVTSLSNLDRKQMERQRSTCLKILNEYFGKWCSYSLSNGVFMKLLFLEEGDFLPNGFCFLRISAETEHVLQLRIGFSNVSVHQRSEIIFELKQQLSLLNEDGFYLLAVCKKPMRQLMIKYGDEERKLSSKKRRKSATNSSFNMPISPLISELDTTMFTPVLRAYLRKKKWIWFTGLNEVMGNYFRGFDNELEINDLAFKLIYNKRLKEGFLPIYESINSTTLYLETTRPRVNSPPGPVELLSPSEMITCSIQFVLHKDFSSGNLITELWMEPTSIIVSVPEDSLDDHLYPYLFEEEFIGLSKNIESMDNQITDHLFTFLSLNLLSKSTEVTQSIFFSIKKFGGEMQQIQSKFDLSPILEQSKTFSVTLFRVPIISSKEIDSNALMGTHCSMEMDPESSSSNYFTPIEMSFSKDAESLETSHSVNSKMDCLIQTLLYLNTPNSDEQHSTLVFSYFFEEVFREVFNGNFSPGDFQRNGMNKEYLDAFRIFIESKICLVNSEKVLWTLLRDSRCFVKSLSPEILLLLFLPRYEGNAKSLIQVSLFECVLPSLSDGIYYQPSPIPFRPYQDSDEPSITTGFKFNDQFQSFQTFTKFNVDH